MRQPHDLTEIARRAMRDRGLEPEFPPEALREAERLEPGLNGDREARDLTGLLWSSIDNDDTRDLDQLEVAEEAEGGAIRLRVAIADVDSLVQPGSAIDDHARTNTTSVYTAARIFPMLPERLSTGLTSLNDGEDRLALVIEMTVAKDGSVGGEDLYPARVRNRAQLAYNAVAAWLDGDGPMPPRMAEVKGIPEQVRLQDEAASRLRRLRFERGALDLDTRESKAVVVDGMVTDLREERQNRAKELIEDFMIAANGATARFLDAHGLPVLRRMVSRPKRWPRIVEIARALGERLPAA
jgi:VacB/RNase II family 3'-5' exoribonuclease